MLRCERVSFAYRSVRPVLSGVSAVFEPGRIAVVLGPNGSGKTTLARLLIGALRPSAGGVRLDGRPVRAWPPGLLARRLAYVAQRPAVSFDFPVRRVIELGRQAITAAPVEHRRAVDRAIERCELTPLAGEPFGALSAGQQQRVAFARALAQLDAPAGAPRAAPCLVADEPLSALDPRHGALTERTLRELAADGAAVVLILHDLAAGLRLADDALLLSPGHASELAPAAAILTPDQLGAVFRCRFDSPAPGVLVPTPDGPAAAGARDP